MGAPLAVVAVVVAAAAARCVIPYMPYSCLSHSVHALLIPYCTVHEAAAGHKQYQPEDHSYLAPVPCACVGVGTQWPVRCYFNERYS